MEKTYTPTKEDFTLLDRQDLYTDKNFASQSYWKGVAIHFFKNRRAVIGLVIVLLIFLFAAIGGGDVHHFTGTVAFLACHGHLMAGWVELGQTVVVP